MEKYINYIFDSFLPPSTEEEKQQGLLTPIGNEIKLSNFKQKLQNTGLTLNDIRLKGIKNWIQNWNEINNLNNRPTTWVTREEFHDMLSDRNEYELILKALKGQFVIPDMVKFRSIIKEIYDKVKRNKNGENASYIPQLARAKGRVGLI